MRLSEVKTWKDAAKWELKVRLPALLDEILGLRKKPIPQNEFCILATNSDPYVYCSQCPYERACSILPYGSRNENRIPDILAAAMWLQDVVDGVIDFPEGL